MNDTGLNEEGRHDHFGPTLWGDAEMFQRLLEDTEEARTDDHVRMVKMAVEAALHIFERANTIRADEVSEWKLDKQ